MVFPDSKVVETDLIGALDLVDQVPHPLRCVLGAAGLVERCRETIDPDLHQYPRLADDANTDPSYMLYCGRKGAAEVGLG